jgi:hypothetical protein
MTRDDDRDERAWLKLRRERREEGKSMRHNLHIDFFDYSKSMKRSEYEIIAMKFKSFGDSTSSICKNKLDD